MKEQICPDENYFWNGDKCEILNLGLCGALYRFDEDLEQCVFKQKICNPPYTWDEKIWRCIKTEYNCPTGFTYRFGKCEQVFS